MQYSLMEFDKDREKQDQLQGPVDDLDQSARMFATDETELRSVVPSQVEGTIVDNDAVLATLLHRHPWLAGDELSSTKINQDKASRIWKLILENVAWREEYLAVRERISCVPEGETAISSEARLRGGPPIDEELLTVYAYHKDDRLVRPKSIRTLSSEEEQEVWRMINLFQSWERAFHAICDNLANSQ